MCMQTQARLPLITDEVDPPLLSCPEWPQGGGPAAYRKGGGGQREE